MRPVGTLRLDKPVEVLGKGSQIAAYGIHPDTKQPYEWPLESLVNSDLEHLPVTTDQGLVDFTSECCQLLQLPATVACFWQQDFLRSASGRRTSEEPPRALGRNNDLFRYLKDEVAPRASGFEELLACAHQRNLEYPSPLLDAEVVSTATSIWQYKERGQLFSKGTQFIVLPLGKEQVIELAKRNSYAIALFALLKATRATRKFTIPQHATADLLGWGTRQVKKAIDHLIDQGYLEEAGERRVGNAEGNRWPAILHKFALPAFQPTASVVNP
jgi:hypothetical protein